METNNQLKDSRLRIMVYAVESFDFKTPEKPIENNKFVLEFHLTSTEKDLSDCDGVIFLGETFEEYVSKEMVCVNVPEKLKRIKQLTKLFKEKKLLSELEKQKEIIFKIESDIETYKRFKGCLAFSEIHLLIVLLIF